MGCLGVHFSLGTDEVKRLRDFEDDADRLEYVTEVLEEKYLSGEPERSAQSDKAWDAMHRALAGGQLTYEGGEYPLNHVVLGGELLYHEDDYIMVLKTPGQVRDVAARLPDVSEAKFRRRYDAIDGDSYDQELGDDDFEYTWENFKDVRAFWLKAAEEGRFVLFTADQ